MTHLLDKSAWMQAPQHPEAARRIAELIRKGGLGLCTVTALEILYSSRNAAEYERDLARLSKLPWYELSQPRRPIDIQGELARRGQHRTSIPDVIITAVAADHDLTILHYDSDYERLSAISGARHEWVVPRGDGHQRSRPSD